MNPDEIANIRARVKERLQNIPLCDNQPYENATNSAGHGLPVGWIFILLAMIAIIATLRGW